MPSPRIHTLVGGRCSTGVPGNIAVVAGTGHSTCFQQGQSRTCLSGRIYRGRQGEGHLSLLQRDGKFQQRLRSHPSVGLRGEGLWPMKVDGGKGMKNREKAAWFPVTPPTFRKERGTFSLQCVTCLSHRGTKVSREDLGLVVQSLESGHRYPFPSTPSHLCSHALPALCCCPDCLFFCKSH